MSESGLQFFATNRAMETLGRIVQDPGDERERRIGMERGGYYFIDTHKFMSDFFATVDGAAMPEAALVANSKTDVFDAFLAKPSVGRVVVCVHGFNVKLHHAVTWFRILTDTMRNNGLADRMVLRADDARLDTAPAGSLTAFIGFSWPSNGSTLAYNRDQADAVASAGAFANLVGRIVAYDKKISLLCHSMGNYMACNALASLVKETTVPTAMTAEYLQKMLGISPQAADAKAKALQTRMRRNVDGQPETFLIDRFVMVAPDVERRHVTKSKDQESKRQYVGPFYSALEHTVRETTNVYSRFDGALNISNLEKRPKDLALKIGDALSSLSFGMLDFLERNPDYKWEMRLGSSAHPVTAPPRMRSLNATEIAGRPIDHSDHIDVPALALAIGKALGLEADA
jgi:hypothetical protein